MSRVPAWRWCWVPAMLIWVGGLPVGFAAEVWRTDFDAAYAEAFDRERPLLIHFYGRSCPPCNRMEQEVLHRPEIAELFTQRYVVVKLDAGDPGNVRVGQLVQRFGIHALPSDVIIDPLSGRILSQTEGYQDFARYRTTAVRSRTAFDNAHKIVIVDQQEPKPVDDPQGRPDESVSLGDPQPIIGMEGFSPVALGAERKWVVGKPEFGFEYKGITYYMATVDELAAFRARPEDFAPRLLGCDPVLLVETDRAVTGSTDFGAFFDGDLYLFKTEESRLRFKSSPLRYTRIQHVLRLENVTRVAAEPREDAEVQ